MALDARTGAPVAVGHSGRDHDEVVGLDVVHLVGDLDVQRPLEHPVHLVERVDVPRGTHRLGQDARRVHDDARTAAVERRQPIELEAGHVARLVRDFAEGSYPPGAWSTVVI